MAELTETTELRETVREKYAAAARAAQAQAPAPASCCGSEIELTDAQGNVVFGSALYGSGESAEAPDGAVGASLGCGVPTAVADLHPGETVLDLGSGAGADVLISARRVGETGRAIGLDMTDEMLELARSNAAGGWREQRRVPEGPHRGHSAAGCQRRCRDLQLRDQPLRRQGQGPG